MKQGLIVYLVGEAEVPENLEPAALGRTLGFPADQVELVSRSEGFFAVEDAWHYLATQGGCARIHLLVVQAEEGEKLKPLSPLVRLCG